MFCPRLPRLFARWREAQQHGVILVRNKGLPQLDKDKHVVILVRKTQGLDRPCQYMIVTLPWNVGTGSFKAASPAGLNSTRTSPWPAGIESWFSGQFGGLSGPFPPAAAGRLIVSALNCRRDQSELRFTCGVLKRAEARADQDAIPCSIKRE